MPAWTSATATHRGRHHTATGRPNEDHARVDAGPPVVAAVADGHGAPRYVRADRGAALATQTAVAVLPGYVDDPSGLPDALVTDWRQRVEEDLASDPPTAREVAGGAPFEVYGTTLVAVVTTDGGLLVAQLGDGDVLLVDRHTGAPHRPVPRRVHAAPNVTDSLVQPDAVAHVRVVHVDRATCDPDLVLLATDGLDTAQPSRRWHDALARRAHQDLRGRDGDEVAAQLAQWCAEAADVGGDDTTMAALVRTGAPDTDA